MKVGDLDITGELRLTLAELGVQDTDGLYQLKREAVGWNLWPELCTVLETCGYRTDNRV